MVSKIFISHSKLDCEIVKEFVRLLEQLGISKDNLLCSSVPGYWIEQGQDIFEYLQKQFIENELYVIFMLSDNYYNSPACLNEMGATWVKNTNYQSILLPNFEFGDIRGAINPRAVSFKLDDELNLKYRLNELKNSITSMFGLSRIDDNIWESKRDEFVQYIKGLVQHLFENPKSIQDADEGEFLYQQSLELIHYAIYDRSKYKDLKLKNALSLINEALALNPNSSSYLHHKGLIFSYIGDYNKSIECYSKALELNPYFSFGYRCRGLDYARLYKYEESIGDYNKAIEVNPTCAVYYKERAGVYDTLDEIEKAFEDKKKAKELDEQG